MNSITNLKRCSKCKKSFPATLEFFHHHKGRRDGLHAWCIKCKRIGEQDRNRRYYERHRDEILKKAKAYHHANPEKQKTRHRKWYLKNKELSDKRVKEQHIKLRKLVLDAYGNKCECCGETHYEFLAIDHIDGGGRKHRKSISKNFYYWLRDNNFPEGFRILCHNCNMSHGFYGYCPHDQQPN